MAEQKTSKSPMNETGLNPWELSKIALPVIPWFKKINPERSANAENAEVTFFFFKKLFSLAIEN